MASLGAFFLSYGRKAPRGRVNRTSFDRLMRIRPFVRKPFEQQGLIKLRSLNSVAYSINSHWKGVILHDGKNRAPGCLTGHETC